MTAAVGHDARTTFTPCKHSPPAPAHGREAQGTPQPQTNPWPLGGGCRVTGPGCTFCWLTAVTCSADWQSSSARTVCRALAPTIASACQGSAGRATASPGSRAARGLLPGHHRAPLVHSAGLSTGAARPRARAPACQMRTSARTPRAAATYATGQSSCRTAGMTLVTRQACIALQQTEVACQTPGEQQRRAHNSTFAWQQEEALQ